MRRRWFLAIVFMLCSCLGAQTQGERLFASVCARCHGLDGRGGEHGPNLAGSELRRRSDAALLRIIHDGRPAAGMPGFGTGLGKGGIEAVVQWVRQLQGRTGRRHDRAAVEKGRALFFGRAHCSDCHSMGGAGGFLAAELTGWGRGRSEDAARQAITHADAGAGAAVTTQAGDVLTGVVRNEDNFSLQLQTADGAFHFFRKGDLKRIERTPVVPHGSPDPEELNALTAFLLDGAESK
jgi:cytochrome c oxidase cbb3-type subunit 3